AVLWATDEGVHYQSLQADNVTLQGSVPPGWPGFRDLYRETFHIGFGDLSVWQKMPWPVFNAPGAGSSAQKVGLVVKVKTVRGGTGILLGISTPARVFGRNWASNMHENVLYVALKEHESGQVVQE